MNEEQEEAEKSNINIRGIPTADIKLMAVLAAKNGRSTEAEFRYLVTEHLRPIRLQMEFDKNKSELAKRLNFAFISFLETNPSHSSKLSVLAEAIGLENGGSIENWFSDGREVPFDVLKKLAAYFNCSQQWLMHGDGEFNLEAMA